MRTAIEKSELVTEVEATELEYQHFPRILSRRSYLKELFLGVMVVVGTAVTQKGYEAATQNADSGTLMLSNILKNLRGHFGKK
jgi:hypothetical protein